MAEVVRPCVCLQCLMLTAFWPFLTTPHHRLLREISTDSILESPTPPTPSRHHDQRRGSKQKAQLLVRAVLDGLGLLFKEQHPGTDARQQ